MKNMRAWHILALVGMATLLSVVSSFLGVAADGRYDDNLPYLDDVWRSWAYGASFIMAFTAMLLIIGAIMYTAALIVRHFVEE